MSGTLQTVCIFGVNTASVAPANYYVPGTGNPAVSTGDYYWSNPYWMRCYDLVAMGTPGANVSAANGDNRYVWVWSEDHPSVGGDWSDQYFFWIGFSNDPGVLPDPSTMYCPIPSVFANWSGGLYGGATAASLGITTGVTDMVPWLVYNPDDASFPFYLYTQGHADPTGGEMFIGALHRSADMVVWTPYGGALMPDTSTGQGGAGNFNRVDRINSTTWVSRGFGPRTIFNGDWIIWNSTDGKSFKPSGSPSLDRVYNGVIPPDSTVAGNFSTSATPSDGVLTPVGFTPFSAGDVGKAIYVTGANSNNNGGTWSTIASYNAGTGAITINVNIERLGNYNSQIANFNLTITNQPLPVEVVALPTQVLGTAGTSNIIPGTQSLYHLSANEDVTIGGQLYAVSEEWVNWATAATESRFITLVPIDSNFNCLSSPAQIRISPGTVTYNNVLPSPEYLQDVNSYQEDGILHIYACHGWSTQVAVQVGSYPYGQGGALLHKFIDYYTYVYDTSAAAQAAPCGVAATSSRGTVTLTWNNAVASTTYVVNRYTSLANLNSNTSPTLVGSVVSGSSIPADSTAIRNTIFDTPGSTGQFWYKIANNNGGKYRSVHAYVDVSSAFAGMASSFVNQHINRVADDNGGSIPASLNATHLARVNSWLTAQGLQSNLLYWADARFGTKTVASKLKVYCLGTTKLPRGLDFWADTTSTTYSATALNGTLPGWLNTTNSNHMMWGVNPNDQNQTARFNQIRRKTQITVAGLYQRASSTDVATLLGSATSTSGAWGIVGDPLHDGVDTGMYLTHGTGTPGTISFALRDNPGIDVTLGGANVPSVHTATSQAIWTWSPNSIIVCVIVLTNGVLASAVTPTASGLTFTKRSSLTFGTTNDLEVWWAPAPSIIAFPGVTVTVATTGAVNVTNLYFTTFAISGVVNPSAPWDAVSSFTATGTNSTPTVPAVTTTAANTILLGMAGAPPGDLSVTAPGATFFTVGNNTTVQEKILSAALGSTSVAYGAATGAAQPWGMIVDAVVLYAPLKVATVAASGNTNTVAVGTYDGTSMYAYSDGTRGTAVTTFNPNPLLAAETFLSGARNFNANPKMPFLCSGSQSSYYSICSGVALTDGSSPYYPGIQSAQGANPGSAPGRTFSTNEAKFNCGSLAVFDVALTQAQVKSLTTVLNGATVDIKADYGAIGDGQIANGVTVSIASGTNILTCSTPIFNTTPNAEVGKVCTVTGAGSLGSTNTLGGGLITASSPLGDGKQVTLTNVAVHTLVNSVQSVEWGHDDGPAFATFNADWQGQEGLTLTIPAGRYCFYSGGSVFTHGITGLSVNGTGSPVLSNMLAGGNGPGMGGVAGTLYGINSHTALTQTVTPGTTVIPLINTSDISFFSANTFAVMTGYDVQDNGGYPPNPEWSEYVYILAVHTGAGGGDPSTVTIQSPLKYTYKSTWPLWDIGPALLQAIEPGWDCAHVYNDLVVAVANIGTPFNCNGRSITFNGGSAEAFPPNNSTIHDFTMTNYSIPVGTWELDKLVDVCTISGSTIRGIQAQSPAPTDVTLSNVTITDRIWNFQKFYNAE